MIAAEEILPASLPRRETVLALIEQHDTPYSWYMQFQRSGQIPGKQAWARLDRKMAVEEAGVGLILLALLKLVDIAGHDDLSDVTWFIGSANEGCLREKGLELPVPHATQLPDVLCDSSD